MPLATSLRQSEEDLAFDVDGPSKATLLRTLSSQGRAEAAKEARMQLKKPAMPLVEERSRPEPIAEDAKEARRGGKKPATPIVEEQEMSSRPGSRPSQKPPAYLKAPFRLEPTDSMAATYSTGSNGKMREIVVRESDLRKYGNDIRKLNKAQVRPPSPGSVSVATNLDMSFKSAFALRCRDGSELRDPWQGMKNPEFSREQSEQDLVLNQVWINAMPARKKLYDLEVAVDEAGPFGTPRSPPRLDADMVPSPPSASSAGATTRRRTRRTTLTACNNCHHRSCPSCAMKAGQGYPAVGSDRPWARGTAMGRSRTVGSASPRDQKLKKTPVESRIKNIEDVFGAEDDEAESLFGSMAVRAATKMQKANIRKISDRLYYDEIPRAAWLAINPETGDVTFYHRDVAQRLESAYRTGRQSVPLEGLGQDVDGTIVTFPAEKAGGRALETSLKGKCRELVRMGVPGTTRDLLVATVREGGVWRFASEGDREHAIRSAAEEDEPEEDFKYQEKKMALTGQEIVMPENNKLPPVNRNQRVYYINPTFTEYY